MRGLPRQGERVVAWTTGGRHEGLAPNVEPRAHAVTSTCIELAFLLRGVSEAIAERVDGWARQDGGRMATGTLRCFAIDVEDLDVGASFWSELTGIRCATHRLSGARRPRVGMPPFS